MMKKILSLLLISCLGYIPATISQTWTSMGSGLGSGTDAVKAIAESPVTHELYAGGTFPGYLMKWDSVAATWNAVGGGINGPVYALGFKNNELFVGGLFTQVGGSTTVSNFAKFSGGTWSDVGGGFNDQVNCIYISPASGSVYAGGKFTQSGTTTLNHISKLNSTTWTALGSGIGAIVNAITEYNSTVYAGSEMNQSPIHKFDGSAWTAITEVSGGKVFALAVFQNNLYAGGDFSQPTFAAAKFNGTTWGTIQTTFSNTNKIYALFKGYNYLYIGGNFTNLGPVGYQASYIAKITSATNPIQSVTLATSTVGGEVYAIGSRRYKPVIGGKFSSPGNNVATTDLSINVDELEDLILDKSVFPNPAHDYVTIAITSKKNMSNPAIQIFDLQSRLVQNAPAEIVNQNNKLDIKVDVSSLAPGNYYYVLTEDGSGVTSDKFIVE